MLDAVIELTQQQAARRMAQAAEEYAAANNQLGYAISEVDRVRIRRQMVALEAEMRDLALRVRQPWHNYLAQIDYTRATSAFKRVNDHLQLQGGAALLMLQNYKTLGGQWCVEGLRTTLRGQTAHFRSFPVAIMLGDRLDAHTFLTRLGSHLGCPTSTGNDEIALRQMINTVLQALCDSLQSGSVYLIELFLRQTDSLCSYFLPWLIEQFWEPLVVMRWPEVLQKNPLAKIVLIIEVEPALKPVHVPAALVCRSTSFDSTRILELPLQKWTQQEIENWLLRFSGLTTQAIGRTPDDVRQLAARIYSTSRGGTPDMVYYHFLQELPRDERPYLGELT